MVQPIAMLSLLARGPGQDHEFPITVAVGAPYEDGTGSWACPVVVTGLHDRLADIVGEDSLQALCLAIQLAGRLLAAFVARGGHLRSPGDEPTEAFPLEAYFGTLGSP
jgi:hypothetical protein